MISNKTGPLAQSVEQFPFKEWVAGSNPAGLTKNPVYEKNKNKKYRNWYFKSL